MKKLFLFLIASVMLFSSCAGEVEHPEEAGGYDISGNQSKDKPSPGNYFIYTPIIDIFTPESGGEVSFLDYDGTKFIMDSGTDKAFLLSYDLSNGKTENLTNSLGFHSEDIFLDGRDYYYIDNDGSEFFIVHKNSAGETIEKIRTTTEEAEYPEDYVLPEIDFEFFRSGEKIILIKNYESGSLSTFCYNTENGEIIEHHKNSAVSGHETVPTNGYVTYVEEKNGLYTIYSLEPESEKREKKGPSVSEKVLFSAFDGEHFVWSTESGIYYKNSSGKYIQVSESGGRFFSSEGERIYWTSPEGNLRCHYIETEEAFELQLMTGLRLIYSDEEIAVFECENEKFREKYLSLSIERVEKPLSSIGAAGEAPFCIRVDNCDYFCFFEGSGGIIPSDEQISGKITSVWCDSSTGPKKNDQSNDIWFFGSRYAFIDGVLYLENINGKGWYKCEKADDIS